MLAQAVMTDSSRKTPPTGSAIGPRRPMRSQSQDDRDAEGFAARKEREAGFAEFVSEEITGKYEGAELDQYREQRAPTDRIKRLERKHDELKGDLKEVHGELKGDIKDVRTDVKILSGQMGDLRKDVAGAVGKIDGQEVVLTEMLSLVKRTVDRDLERDHNREHVTFTAKVEVDKAQELAKVEVAKEQELAVIEVTKEEQVDTVKAKHDRRKRNLKIIGLLASGGSVIELLHRLGVL
jgi:uncharacterized protein (UPF0335 family)